MGFDWDEYNEGEPPYNHDTPMLRFLAVVTWVLALVIIWGVAR